MSKRYKHIYRDSEGKVTTVEYSNKPPEKPSTPGDEAAVANAIVYAIGGLLLGAMGGGAPAIPLAIIGGIIGYAKGKTLG